MIRVLIVEDDPMVAEINKSYVNSVDGFKVIGIAKDSLDALSIIKNQQVDLLILDIYLPRGDGISILRELRGLQAQCDVIMVTASSEVDKIDEAFKYGVVDYLIKPFEFERLRQSLKNYQWRRSKLSGEKEISQGDIDNILGSGVKLEDEGLRKGLNNLTLKRIIRILDRKDYYFKIDEIAKESDLTNVTARRYMEYLESIDYVIKEVEHGSIGRPSYIYKRIKRG